jgi:hypothetical protein
MAQPQRYYEPDAIDCNTLVHAIAHDFSCVATIVTDYRNDQVWVTVRCTALGAPGGDVVQVQALVKAPLKSARSPYTMQYGALLDCWHQLDRGTLAVATTPIERRWDGRPQRPTPRKA